MPGAATTPTTSPRPRPVYRGLQSPKRRGSSRYPDPNHGDSPGDVEASQDIFWDPMSPTQVLGHRSSRVVEISDIVNRIAPKDAKPKGTDSPLLQWIGDSAVPFTPEVREPRVRKRSSRQSSVEDLMKLAKQFDKNMQQDKESSEQLNTSDSSLSEGVNTSKLIQTETLFHSNVKDLQCSSSSERVEAELHALFDCSTQKASHPLSQCSSASVYSQGPKDQPGTSSIAKPRRPEPKLAQTSDSAVQPAEEKGSSGFSANSCDDDFDDDWENDDLLNDSFVLAMTQNPDQKQSSSHKASLQPNTKTNTTHLSSDCKSTAAKNSVHQPPNLHTRPNCSLLQQLCPKPKTTNRSTFQLKSNLHFQKQAAEVKEISKSNSAVAQLKSQTSDQNDVAATMAIIHQPGKITSDQRTTCAAADISDSLWDDGDDDALLYQVCDTVERISNSQPQQVSSTSCQEQEDIAVDRQRKTTAPLPIGTTWSTNACAGRRSPCAFVRSNSLPGTSCETVNYQGWNVPMKGANNKSQMSQSLPGSRLSLGAFAKCKDSSGSFQVGNANVDTKLDKVTAGAPQNSHHTAFKRNVSDSAATSNKVFVTSQMTGKCSAAEIERKKQEALARRRLRMQNTQK